MRAGIAVLKWPGDAHAKREGIQMVWSEDGGQVLPAAHLAAAELPKPAGVSGSDRDSWVAAVGRLW